MTIRIHGSPTVGNPSAFIFNPKMEVRTISRIGISVLHVIVIIGR